MGTPSAFWRARINNELADQTRFYNRLNRNYSLKATQWDTVMHQSVARHRSLPSFKMVLKTLV